MLGHFGQRLVVLVECLDLAHTGAANGLLDLIAEPDLLGSLLVASHDRDLVAHFAVAQVPFERDEREAQPIEDQAGDLQPLLVHGISQGQFAARDLT